MTHTVSFRDVSKRYSLGGFRGSLREAIPSLARRLVHQETAQQRAEIWALRDVSFQVGPGEAVAIVGPNGAGKTTALKLATFVTQPTQGQVEVRGRTSALIELGAGFHPDLTGRENIFLNGTILGLKKREIQQRFDSIVEFSELEQFLDTPVKRYSSGMYARLGFSVAAHVNPDILIVDEVLAVGDLAFQSKCLARMSEMVRAGTTVLIVSHHLPRVRRLCDRGIFLYRGHVVADGAIDQVVAAYQNNPDYASNLREASRPATAAKMQSAIRVDSPVVIQRVTQLDADGEITTACRPGARVVVRIDYHAALRVERPVFEVWLHSADGTEYAAYTSQWDGYECRYVEGGGHIDLVLDPVCLIPGRYSLSVAITATDGITRYDWHWQRYDLNVESDRPLQGIVYLPHEWK